MDEIFRNLRQVEVHDVRDAVDVDSSCGNIRGDQHTITPLLKTTKSLIALTLSAIAVNTGGFDSQRRRFLASLSVPCFVRAKTRNAPGSERIRLREKTQLAFLLDLKQYRRVTLSATVWSNRWQSGPDSPGSYR